MLGGGVGFSVKKEDIHELPRIQKNVMVTHECTKDADYIVPDSREGWVKLLHKTLYSFFHSGKSFTYSTILIRGAGEPIKGFGGTASGPRILIEGLEKIVQILKNREGKKLRSIDVLDICNIIGSIVVAGNVRRSALIALGDPDDYLYLRAKRWDLGGIPNWRAFSNNTIFADSYDQISEDVWTGYNGNGEPYGFFNLPLSQKKGRLKDKKKDNGILVNPCLTGDALILTDKGEVKLSDIVHDPQEYQVVTMDTETNTLSYENLMYRGLTQELANVISIKGKDGTTLKLTPHHLVFVKEKGWIPASDIRKGDKVIKVKKELEIDELEVESIEVVENEAVYDLTTETNHNFFANGVLVHNCAEIILADKECCNLSEVFLPNITSKEELLRCCILLYKTQKAVCAGKFIHDETNDVVHKNMRIGVGMGGICQAIDKLDWLDEIYKKLEKFDEEWSKQKGYNKSIRLTTVKPSGSISILSGVTPGVHPGYSQYFIRRIRIASNDKLVETCKKLGYPMEFLKNFDGTENHDTYVISFPCELSEKTIFAKDMSAVRQLELVKQMQTEWSDNSVSVTVYYRKEELPDIKEWLDKNYENSLKTVSFLLHSDHGFAQAPYEEIDEKHYKELIKKVKPISNVMDIGNEILEDVECVGGVCPVR